MAEHERVSEVICMLYDGSGNALEAFDYTADELEARALQLRQEAGEVTTVSCEPSPFGGFFGGFPYGATNRV